MKLIENDFWRDRERVAILGIGFGIGSILVLATAMVFRDLQFRMQDPNQNIFVTLSIGTLIVFFVLWIGAVAIGITKEVRGFCFRSFALWIPVAIGGFWILWFFFRMLIFIFPG